MLRLTIRALFVIAGASTPAGLSAQSAAAAERSLATLAHPDTSLRAAAFRTLGDQPYWRATRLLDSAAADCGSASVWTARSGRVSLASHVILTSPTNHGPMDDSVHQRLSRETDAWTREALRWRHLEVNDSSGTGQAELRLYLVVTPEGANYSGGRVRYALAAATARIKVLADGRCIHSERAKAATRAPRFISASRYRKPRDAPLGFAMQQAIAQALAQLPDSVPGGDARFRAPGPPARDESGAIVPAELELYLEAMIAPFTLDTLARLSSVGYSSWGCGGRPGCASGGSRSSRQVERTLSVYRPNGTTLTVLFIAPDERSPPTDMTVAIDDGWKPGTPVYPPKLGFRLTSPGTDRRSGLLGFTRVEASGDGDTRVWLLRDGAWSEFRP